MQTQMGDSSSRVNTNFLAILLSWVFLFAIIFAIWMSELISFFSPPHSHTGTRNTRVIHDCQISIIREGLTAKPQWKQTVYCVDDICTVLYPCEDGRIRRGSLQRDDYRVMASSSLVAHNMRFSFKIASASHLRYYLNELNQIFTLIWINFHLVISIILWVGGLCVVHRPRLIIWTLSEMWWTMNAE